MKDLISRGLGSRWYALFVRSRHEKAVATILTRKGLNVFLPLVSLNRRWGRRRAEVLLPMFPSYVFSHFDVSSQRVLVLATPGVAKIVGVGHRAMPLEDAEVGAIMRVVETGAASEPWPYLGSGQSVRITEGVLAGLAGTLVEFKNQHRLVLSIQLLQRSVAVEIESSCVESAKS